MASSLSTTARTPLRDELGRGNVVRQAVRNQTETVVAILTGVQVRTDSGSDAPRARSEVERYWADDHPVLEVIRARRRSGRPVGEHGDGHKLGLTIEGGGMRGAVSAAMLTALDDLGLRSVFDVVYGVSSGAVNAAYFLTGESWYPLTIYLDDLPTRRFVDFRRSLAGRAILDLDYVFEHVLEKVKPLAYDKIAGMAPRFQVAVAMVDTLETVSVSTFENGADLKAALRASCWMPIAVPGVGEFRGRPAVDGGVLTAHPTITATRDGCTHVLSLSTRPMGAPVNFSALVSRATGALLDRTARGLGTGYVASLDEYRQHRSQWQRWRTEPGDGPLYVLDLAPLPWMREMPRHERDVTTILTAIREAHALAHAAIVGTPAAEIRDGQFTSVPRLIPVRRKTPFSPEATGWEGAGDSWAAGADAES